MKIENKALTASMRQPGRCRWCGESVNLCGAHVFAKGMAGGSTIDIPCNLVSLGMDPLTDCPCHRSSHDGNEPTFEQLLAISAADHDCLQGSIEDVVYLIRRLPKETTREQFDAAAKRELNFGARRLALRQLLSFEHLLRSDTRKAM